MNRSHSAAVTEPALAYSRNVAKSEGVIGRINVDTPQRAQYAGCSLPGVEVICRACGFQVTVFHTASQISIMKTSPVSFIMYGVLSMLVRSVSAQVTTQTTSNLEGWCPLVVSDRRAEKSSFQSNEFYNPKTDIRSDVAMAYTVDDRLTSRIAAWKHEGYIPHVMTGAAWGGYEKYINGEFDGKRHEHEGQVDPFGEVIWHHPGVPYMVPTPSYIEYLKSLARKSIDAGAEALHFEEPEFWARAGYSEGFKEVWKAEYGEDWQRPDSSPDAFWRSAKLKYLLYQRTLKEVFAEAKAYGESKGRDIRCFVPTHSLVNYAQWGIVSPESSLMHLDNCDGYIAQVWTGTARSPNVYRGVTRERTFEAAFLEYSSMYSMVAPTGRTVYFLADPVEDDPNHTWDDYRQNYERVVAASLLFPEVVHFEVMPWPDRVMQHEYPAGTYAKDSETTKMTIPSSYASELMNVVNALQELQPGPWEWQSGSADVGLLMSDSMMFQRGHQWGVQGTFSDFFGIAMPLVKNGIPANAVIMEQLTERQALADIKVLVASFEMQKPMRKEYNEAIADWVKAGGVLVYVGDESNPFHHVREWWNDEGKTSVTARDDLWKRLGLSADNPTSASRVGKGAVVLVDQHPESLADNPKGHEILLKAVARAQEMAGQELKTTNRILLERGDPDMPYVVGAVLEESGSQESLTVAGTFIDIYTSDLKLRKDPTFEPGEVFLLRRIVPGKFGLVGGNVRLDTLQDQADGSCKVTVRGPTTIPHGLMCMHAAAQPESVTVDSAQDVQVETEWNEAEKLLWIRFPYAAGGVTLTIRP